MSMQATIHEEQDNQISWGPLIWIGLLHVGALLAFVPAYFSWWAVLGCVILHWLTGGIGICMTYHRLLTHRSFATRPKALEYVLTALGCCASEGGPIGWVADHRRHHAHSDQPEDTHSPRRSFGWAHMFWWMTPDITARHTPEYYDRWAPDLCKDKYLVWIDKYHLVFPISLFAALYAFGYYLNGNIGGMSWLAWAGFMRTVLVLHATWLVNSATHIWGYRSHETRDDSTNNWWVALVTYGEGWHNNHHAYQTSVRHGFQWWEFDPTYYGVKIMSWLGLAHSLKFAKIAPKDAGTKATAVESQSSDDAEPELATVAD